MSDIKEKVYGFKTNNEHGFIDSEIQTLLKDFPNINMDKFSGALRGNTVMMIDEKVIHYHGDIEKAIRCGVENRNLRFDEWD